MTCCRKNLIKFALIKMTCCRKNLIKFEIKKQELPNLMEEAITAIKARCKDKNVKVQIISLDLLDKCMSNHGIQFQLHVSVFVCVHACGCLYICV